MFHMDVAKSRSRCCICCNGCTRTLPTSIPNVSSIFSDVLLQECLSRCCICFAHMLQVFYVNVAYVWNGFKCF
jgi:hypothetical protein